MQAVDLLLSFPALLLAGAPLARSWARAKALTILAIGVIFVPIITTLCGRRWWSWGDGVCERGSRPGERAHLYGILRSATSSPTALPRSSSRPVSSPDLGCLSRRPLAFLGLGVGHFPPADFGAILNKGGVLPLRPHGSRWRPVRRWP